MKHSPAKTLASQYEKQKPDFSNYCRNVNGHCGFFDRKLKHSFTLRSTSTQTIKVCVIMGDDKITLLSSPSGAGVGLCTNPSPDPADETGHAAYQTEWLGNHPSFHWGHAHSGFHLFNQRVNSHAHIQG